VSIYFFCSKICNNCKLFAEKKWKKETAVYLRSKYLVFYVSNIYIVYNYVNMCMDVIIYRNMMCCFDFDISPGNTGIKRKENIY